MRISPILVWFVGLGLVGALLGYVYTNNVRRLVCTVVSRSDHCALVSITALTSNLNQSYTSEDPVSCQLTDSLQICYTYAIHTIVRGCYNDCPPDKIYVTLSLNTGFWRNLSTSFDLVLFMWAVMGFLAIIAGMIYVQVMTNRENNVEPVYSVVTRDEI